MDELGPHLKTHWPMLREQLLTGRYQPSLVRRHAIPKSDGGVRELGIPTVLDRFIQQAILQVLSPCFDMGFSEHSYGFRPGRRAHDAVVQAQRYVQQGRRIVVDVDLEPVGCFPYRESLRPREPRRADGKARQSDQGQAIAGAHSSLSRSWDDGEWCRDAKRRRHAARWTFVSIAREHSLG